MTNNTNAERKLAEVGDRISARALLSIDEEFVIDLRRDHAQTWRDKPEHYWLARLMQEVGELGSSLVGDHDDPPEWELRQIAAICINWLEMRRDMLTDVNPPGGAA